MPRFLSRLPYGAKTNPVDEFDFEEDADGADHSKYVWSNAAYAMGVNINRSFKHYGWCTLIRGVESGGAVENLPCHTFPTDDGGVDMKCPTEIAISDRVVVKLNWRKMVLSHLSTAKTLITPPLLARTVSTKTAGVLRSGRYGQRRSLSSVCHIFSPVHGLRTSSNVSCATRSARSKSVKICSAGSMSGL